jgi:imidazolonepropionase-like amidohydrolase
MFSLLALAAACDLALTDAVLIPMDREIALPGHTVLIAEGRIARIGPDAELSAEGCARVIDADGRSLAPGLIDAHIHVETGVFAEAMGVEASEFDYERIFRPYLENGVTGVRVMAGGPDILAFRHRAEAEALGAPALSVSSPMLSGDPPILPEPMTRIVRSPEEARAAVRRYAEAGYDLIKLRRNLDAESFLAVIDEAGRLGLQVDGHINRSLPLPEALGSGQVGLAHLDEITLSFRDGLTTATELLLEHDVHVSTSLSVLASASAQLRDYEAEISRPGVAALNPLFVDAFWRAPANPYLASGASPDFFDVVLLGAQQAVAHMDVAGVRLLAGTDAMNPMILPGESLHDELDLLAAAGLTPYRALRTATVNPAEALPRFAGMGMIAEGRIANLVLVEGTPLSDIRAMRDPVLVILDGRIVLEAR